MIGGITRKALGAVLRRRKADRARSSTAPPARPHERECLRCGGHPILRPYAYGCDHVTRAMLRPAVITVRGTRGDLHRWVAAIAVDGSNASVGADTVGEAIELMLDAACDAVRAVDEDRTGTSGVAAGEAACGAPVTITKVDDLAAGGTL